jgi:SpoIID/LytB domain protein
MVFSPDRDGKLAVINKVGVERLLKGVVPAEIYASAPQQALRAQAVAARNTVMGAIGVRNLADPYMLRADVYDQVYGGMGAQKASTTEAVEATRGEVMFYGKQIVEGVYSSNAGGFTENNEDVWDAEPKPYLRGGPDAAAEEVPETFSDQIAGDELEAFLDSDFPAYSKTAPVSSSQYYRWETSVDASEAAEWLAETDRDVRKITEAEITERGASGRVVRLKLTGIDGQTTVIERELNVRRLFDNLKSGLFTMRVERGDDEVIDAFHFQGAGYGHGVGMCQTGAIGMADRGYTYTEILTHYYTGIDLKSLY